MKIKTYKKLVTVEGVSNCNCYARTDGIMWYNSENPTGCSFVPTSEEDINNYYETIEYGTGV